MLLKIVKMRGRFDLWSGLWTLGQKCVGVIDGCLLFFSLFLVTKGIDFWSLNMYFYYICSLTIEWAKRIVFNNIVSKKELVKSRNILLRLLISLEWFVMFEGDCQQLRVESLSVNRPLYTHNHQFLLIHDLSLSLFSPPLLCFNP